MTAANAASGGQSETSGATPAASASPAPCSNEPPSVFGAGSGYSGAGSFTASFPEGCTQATVSMWGGGGSNATVETGCDALGSGSPVSRFGGAGGYTTGVITLPSARDNPTGRVLFVPVQDAAQSALYGFYAGGGASVVRWNDDPGTSELLVAGGGGSASTHNGGAGGGVTGESGSGGGSRRSCFPNESSTTGGGGGTAVAGGAGGGCDTGYANHLCPGNMGARQTGANTSPSIPNQGAPGGNGFYGGGQGAASAYNASGGGGGSGFVDPSVSGSTHAGSGTTPGASGGSETDRTDSALGNPNAGEPAQAGKVIIRWAQ
ncbi:MAG: hypothetical protein Alpg2KO_30050 [Alphaproteobacteria bacterium]